MNDKIIELENKIKELEKENNMLKHKIDSILGYISVSGLTTILTNCVKSKL
tara:strand:+ start:302 stop:454 length:153 start_codon:yes stop_codon:yes gene_type:complete